MANRYYVGGTGNWSDDTNHWATTSGGTPGAGNKPGAADTGILDASSGGGTVTMDEAVSITGITMGAFTGTLNTNGQTVTLTGTFSVTGSGVRTLTLGASAISCGNWIATTTTNLTFNANTSTITLTSSQPQFAGGGKTYNNVVFQPSGSSADINDIGNTFANLTVTGTTIKNGGFFVRSGGTTTITGILTINGNSTINRILVRSRTNVSATPDVGNPATLSAATVTITNADFQDITGAGAGSWDLSAITGLSGDCGGNSGITFTTADENFWIGGTGSWSTAGEWSTTSGGAANGRVPLPQDDATFDVNSFSAGSLTVTADMPRLGKNINWTGATNTPTFTTSTVASIFGSLTLISGMTLTASTQAYTFEGRGIFTLTNATKTWSKNITLNAPAGGTLIIQDAFSLGATNTLTVTNGTFSANNQSVTVGLFSSSNSNTRTITMGSGTWTLTGDAANIWTTSTTTNLTMTANTATIKLTGTLTAARNFVGGSLNFNGASFWNATTGAFAVVITGSNTFNDFKIDAGRTQHFTAATTTTMTTFTAVGTDVSGITITSATAANHTLSDTAGTNTVSYCTISRSTAQGGATWNAPSDTNTDGGNNSGWDFTIVFSVNVFESISITESVSTEIESNAFSVSISDSISITENVSLISILEQSFFETIGITENVNNEVQLGNISLSEVISITESVSLILILEQSSSETIGITENISLILILEQSFFETIGITENVNNEVQLGNISLSESVSITENIIQTQIFNTDLITESITITENASTDLFTFGYEPPKYMLRGFVD